MTTVNSSLGAFSSNVIVEPAGVLVEKKVPTPPGCYTVWQPMNQGAAFSVSYDSDMTKGNKTTYYNPVVRAGVPCQC